MSGTIQIKMPWTTKLRNDTFQEQTTNQFLNSYLTKIRTCIFAKIISVSVALLKSVMNSLSTLDLCELRLGVWGGRRPRKKRTAAPLAIQREMTFALDLLFLRRMPRGARHAQALTATPAPPTWTPMSRDAHAFSHWWRSQRKLLTQGWQSRL